MDRASSWGKADLQGRWGQEQHNCVFIKCQPICFMILHFCSGHSAALLILPAHTNISAYLFVCFACACEYRVHMYVCMLMCVFIEA